MDALYPWMHLVGRTLFAMICAGSGISHFTQRAGMAQYAAARGLPAAGVMVPLSGAWILVGALFVILGWHRFIGAGMLALFLFPTAFLMHGFWREADPQARMMEQTHFFKDLAMAGAALVTVYYAGAPWPTAVQP